MKVLLFQLDGKIPNIALMRIAAHHRSQGDEIEFQWGLRSEYLQRGLWQKPDRIYASLIFEKTRPRAERLLQEYPKAIVGGTGWNLAGKLEDHGIATTEQDYSIYPDWQQSIGFTQRGCRFDCWFCVVPRKEGKVKEASDIERVWRGDPWPRELILLDNDFFGQPRWRQRIESIKSGGFKVSFCQGITVRCITDEAAAAISSVDYRANNMKDRRIYTAWDDRKDEKGMMKGLKLLLKHGVKPQHIMAYILLTYKDGKTVKDWEYRRAKLREFGVLPYPMPYIRNDETRGFQRWVVMSFDKWIPWSDWVKAGYQPRNLAQPKPAPIFTE